MEKLSFKTSKLYGVNDTIIIFVFVKKLKSKMLPLAQPRHQLKVWSQVRPRCYWDRQKTRRSVEVVKCARLGAIVHECLESRVR